MSIEQVEEPFRNGGVGRGGRSGANELEVGGVAVLMVFVVFEELVCVHHGLAKKVPGSPSLVGVSTPCCCQVGCLP